MENIKAFIEKWGVTIALCGLGTLLVFALVSCIYTAVANPFVGIVGLLGAITALGIDAWAIYKNIKQNKA